MVSLTKPWIVDKIQMLNINSCPYCVSESEFGAMRLDFKNMPEINLNEQNFDLEVMHSNVPVLVDFWAIWCGPCKVLGPIVDELAQEYQGKLKVGKVNVDENNALAFRFNVMSIPTLKFFKNGKMVGELIGAAPKATVESEIKKYL